jgi:hypothetical protein
MNVQDDTRLWNVARSAQEIQSSYCSVLGHKNHGLLAYWKFEEVCFFRCCAALLAQQHRYHLRAEPISVSPWVLTINPCNVSQTDGATCTNEVRNAPDGIMMGDVFRTAHNIDDDCGGGH